MIRKLVASLPNIRGKQRSLSTLDKYLGPSKMAARHGIQLEGYYSSIQDLAFCRSTSDNPMLEELISLLPKDGIFIDCGANCGFYSSMAAKVLGREGTVISFEPSIREYRRLLNAVKFNVHLCTWLTLHQAAGDSNGIATIATSVGHTGMNQICSDAKPSGQKNSVWMVPVDEVINTILKNRETIELIKIDVEGYEMGVLRGLSESLKKRRIAKIVVEVTDRFLQERGESKKSMLAYMDTMGYVATINSDEWQYDEVFVRL